MEHCFVCIYNPGEKQQTGEVTTSSFCFQSVSKSLEPVNFALIWIKVIFFFLLLETLVTWNPTMICLCYTENEQG